MWRAVFYVYRCRAILGLVLGLGAIPPLPVSGAAAVDCRALAEQIEQRDDIPPGLLQAIALAESGRNQGQGDGFQPWPWAVRSGPDGFYLPTREAALSKVRELQGAGRTNIDVGCMQVNLGYHGTAFASLEDAFDPSLNVGYGALFLRRLWRETGSWAEATGRYHTADPYRGQAYRARVHKIWRELSGRQRRPLPVISEASFVGASFARVVGGRRTGQTTDVMKTRVHRPVYSTGRPDQSAPALTVVRGGR